MITRQDSRRYAEEAGSDAPDRQTIVLFGEILADVFPDRIVLGGAPFNVARHLAAFGLGTLLVSRVGDDDLGGKILAAMAAAGMDAHGVQVDRDRPTGRVLVHMETGGHRFEILDSQAFDFIDPDTARSAVSAIDPVMVYFGTLSQRGDISRRALAAVLETSSAPRFVDMNLRDPWYTPDTIRFSLAQADILKINAEELMALGRLFGLDGEDQEDRVRGLMRHFDIGRAIVTCAEEGAWQVTEGGQWSATPLAFWQPDVVDTVGAGDGFAAVCILGAVAGWPLPETLNRADAFARTICGLRGAVPDSADFYRPFLREWHL